MRFANSAHYVPVGYTANCAFRPCQNMHTAAELRTPLEHQAGHPPASCMNMGRVRAKAPPLAEPRAYSGSLSSCSLGSSCCTTCCTCSSQRCTSTTCQQQATTGATQVRVTDAALHRRHKVVLPSGKWTALALPGGATGGAKTPAAGLLSNHQLLLVHKHDSMRAAHGAAHLACCCCCAAHGLLPAACFLLPGFMRLTFWTSMLGFDLRLASSQHLRSSLSSLDTTTTASCCCRAAADIFFSSGSPVCSGGRQSGGLHGLRAPADAQGASQLHGLTASLPIAALASPVQVEQPEDGGKKSVAAWPQPWNRNNTPLGCSGFCQTTSVRPSTFCTACPHDDQSGVWLECAWQ